MLYTLYVDIGKYTSSGSLVDFIILQGFLPTNSGCKNRSHIPVGQLNKFENKKGNVCVGRGWR